MYETGLILDLIRKSEDLNIQELREELFIAIKLIHGEELERGMSFERRRIKEDIKQKFGVIILKSKKTFYLKKER